jgi:transposase
VPSGSPSGPGSGCSPAWTPATPPGRSGRRGSPRRNCAGLRHPDLAEARRRLVDFYLRAAHSEVPELERLAGTISRWEHEILAYFTTGKASHGRTEAVNLLIKRIKRVGFGFRSFRN